MDFTVICLIVKESYMAFGLLEVAYMYSVQTLTSYYCIYSVLYPLPPPLISPNPAHPVGSEYINLQTHKPPGSHPPFLYGKSKRPRPASTSKSTTT